MLSGSPWSDCGIVPHIDAPGDSTNPSPALPFTPPPITALTTETMATIAAAPPDSTVQKVRVLVLNYEPTIPEEDNRTLWQIFGWSDPRQLAAGYVADLEAATDGGVDYEIVQWRDLNEFPIFTDGSRYTPAQYVENRRTNTGWSTASADFYAIARQQNLAQLINDGTIDEIWMFGDHYFALLGEAWMTGPESFFINGPSFPDLPIDRAVAGYGFSYERGVAEMLHNHGHRTENHMSRAYDYSWNISNPATPWDYFTANVAQTNGSAYGVGSVHYPFNAASDYDYANTQLLPSYAEDFLENFPDQTYQTELTGRQAWGDLGTGDWHRGYLKWFFEHMPRGAGQGADGRQNNWFKYLYDFNAYRPFTGAPRDNEAILGAASMRTDGRAEYEFTARFYDVEGLDARSIDDDDIYITRFGGFEAPAKVIAIAEPQPTTAGTAVTVSLSVTGPGGQWDSGDAGVYNVWLRPDAVLDAAGNPMPGKILGNFQVVFQPPVTDTEPPTAEMGVMPTAEVNQRTSGFTVRYRDNEAIDIRSLNFGDVVVYGPNGFVQTAALYGVPLADALDQPVDYFFTAPGGTWDVGDNGEYRIELVADAVHDAAGNSAAAVVLGQMIVDIPEPESRPPQDLTEMNADDWYAWAADADAWTFDDTDRKVEGEASVRFETTGGFDTLLRYQPDHGVRWDLTFADRLQLSIYAENPSPVGFQVEPWVILTDTAGQKIQYRYYRNGSPYALWNDARGQWLTVPVPLVTGTLPSSGWRAPNNARFDWSNVQSVELHADTWDSGFTLWLDRVHFVFKYPGDVNSDTKVDASDLDLIAAQIRSGVYNPKFDIVADQVIDHQDKDFVITKVLKTSRGDLDLDGDVDTADLLDLIAGWTGGLEPGEGDAGWATGDTDGDADVDTLDLLDVLEHWTAQ